MDALGQHPHGERPAGNAAQRCREPQPVPVAAARIEADHQRRLADPLHQVIDVERQVVAAALLAGLDHDDAAPARHLLLGQRLERAQAGIDRIAVVGPAAAIELVALQHRDPRPRALGPALHLGLLVEMAVEQDGVVAVARHFDEDQRRPALQPHHLQGSAGKPCELRRGPAHHQRDGILHVAVLDPLRIEVRRLVGDADVLGDRGEDGVVPEGIDELSQAVGVHAGHAAESVSGAPQPSAKCAASMTITPPPPPTGVYGKDGPCGGLSLGALR